MQHRQTTVIGAILAVMVVAVAVSLLVSLGILPAYNPGFSQPKSTATYVPQTCPPSGAKTVDVTTIEKINIYNGSESVGLAATVQQELEEAHLHITSANDWPGGIYNGEVQIMASKGGLTNAYSLAQIFPNSTVQLDKSLSDDDTTVSVVLGKEYLQNALKSDEIKLLGADKPITAPNDCVPARFDDDALSRWFPASIEAVLLGRGLRCPPDDWGLTSVIWSRSTFWVGNAVPDSERHSV